VALQKQLTKRRNFPSRKKIAKFYSKNAASKNGKIFQHENFICKHLALQNSKIFQTTKNFRKKKPQKVLFLSLETLTYQENQPKIATLYPNHTPFKSPLLTSFPFPDPNMSDDEKKIHDLVRKEIDAGHCRQAAIANIGNELDIAGGLSPRLIDQWFRLFEDGKLDKVPEQWQFLVDTVCKVSSFLGWGLAW
jgi:hypothetical protein